MPWCVGQGSCCCCMSFTLSACVIVGSGALSYVSQTCIQKTTTTKKQKPTTPRARSGSSLTDSHQHNILFFPRLPDFLNLNNTCVHNVQDATLLLFAYVFGLNIARGITRLTTRRPSFFSNFPNSNRFFRIPRRLFYSIGFGAFAPFFVHNQAKQPPSNLLQAQYINCI